MSGYPNPGGGSGSVGTLAQVLAKGADANGVEITDGHDPTAAQSLATKHYVDTSGVGGPPSGSAGGGLAGTYPNPLLNWQPATGLIAYVDYVNGNDSNSGLYPSYAFKTIAAAYSALTTIALAHFTAVGGRIDSGTIILLPGDHDVGTGLVLDYRYRITLQGTLSGGVADPAVGITNSGSRIVSSSSSATALILIGSTSNVTYGNRICDVGFVVNPAVNTSLTACVRVQATDYFQMERCQGITSDSSQQNVYLLEQNPGGSAQDNAWVRFLNNNTNGLPLYYAPTGTNFNRGFLGYNVAQFGGAGATVPMIWLQGDWASGIVMGNNLEGGLNAPHLQVDAGAATNNLYLNNAGESNNTGGTSFYQFNGGSGIVIGGDCTYHAGSIGTWATMASNAYPYTIYSINADYTGLASYKRKIVNNATYPARNQVYGKDGRILWQKVGNAPTFSSSDFPGGTLPADGTMIGVTHDTTGATYKVWVVIDGAVKSATVS